MNNRILVTCATGKVGRALVHELHLRGASVRAGLHSFWKTCGLGETEAELVPFDFADTGSVESALAGVHTLALLTPVGEHQVEWAIRTIDLAKQAGVERIVRMSVLAAAMEPGIQIGRWHRTVERYLIGSGLDWTIVRPGPFMQNFLGMYPRAEGAFRLPVGSAAINHVDVADVAAALATVITQTGHSKRTYMLTGREPLSMERAARALSEPGRPLDYETVSVKDAREHMLAAGRPPWLVEALLELFSAFDSGAVALQTSTFRDLTGREPRAFTTFARDA